MYLFTKSLIVIFISVFALSVQVNSAPTIVSKNCNKLQVEADACIKRTMLLFDRDVRFPRTQSDIDFYCDQVDVNLKCVRKYSQCLKAFPKQVFGVIMSNLKAMMKDMCSNNQTRQDILYHAKCLNEKTMPEVHQVVDIMNRCLNYIANNVSIDDKIPNLCCGFFLGREIVKSKVASLCDAVTGPETKEYVLHLLSRASSDAIDLGCGQYSSIESCDIKVPQQMKILRKLASNSSRSSFGDSFFMPIIKIAEDLVS